MSVKERSEKYMIAEKYDAIIMGIRGLKDNYGLRDDPNFLIGLSGGKDSAVVAALLCDAVGADKVTAINMPTVYNSEITKIAAAQIAVALGINYKIMPIKKIVDAVEETIEGMDLDGTGRKLSVLNKENIQAKIRGTDMLSNIASKYGMIFSNNGNKLEVFTGYCTLYGDTNGAFSPIADLLASEVFDMARYINELHGCEIIPKILIPDRLYRFGRGQIQPTAGLKENQVDPFLWGFDDGIVERVRNYKSASIENIMEWYLDGTLEKNISTSKEIIQYRNMDNPKEFVTHLEWLFSLYQQNVFKRKFVPLTFMLSKSAFGDDYMESILLHNKTMNYGELKAKVLSMKNYYDTSSIYRLNFDINKLLA
jgi:NAD+ synthase (glutamine-hydrolysing)